MRDLTSKYAEIMQLESDQRKTKILIRMTPLGLSLLVEFICGKTAMDSSFLSGLSSALSSLHKAMKKSLCKLAFLSTPAPKELVIFCHMDPSIYKLLVID